jgi:hypothetical protein
LATTLKPTPDAKQVHRRASAQPGVRSRDAKAGDSEHPLVELLLDQCTNDAVDGSHGYPKVVASGQDEERTSMTITGAHVIIYSQDAEADRAFIRDTLGFAGVDAGGGWLIFKLPPAEIALHPTDGEAKHEFYLMCDNIESTLGDLTAKGVEVSGTVRQERWGLIASINLPSGADLPIYEPRHPVAYALEG